MKHIDLFTGIGGFSLAAQWVWGDEHEIVCFCEPGSHLAGWGIVRVCEWIFRYREGL